jgi:hypothetical protein
MITHHAILEPKLSTAQMGLMHLLQRQQEQQQQESMPLAWSMDFTDTLRPGFADSWICGWPAAY